MKSRSEAATKPKLSKQQYRKQQAYFLNSSKGKHGVYQQSVALNSQSFTSPSPIFIDTNFTSFQALASNIFNSQQHGTEHSSKPELILSPSSDAPQMFSVCAESSPPYLPTAHHDIESSSTNLVKNAYPSVEMIDYSSKCELMN